MKTIKMFIRSEVPPDVWQVVHSVFAATFEHSRIVAWSVCGEGLVDDRGPIDAWLLSQGCSRGEIVSFYE